MSDTIATNEWSEQQSFDGLLISRPFARYSKRALDLASGIVLLPVTLLVMGAAAILIKLSDGGPIIHRRRVIGPKGAFDAYKIRTMVVDADERLQQDAKLRTNFEKNFKLEADPRITRIGRFLRRYSLDEFPQVFNVLRGQMTMVGPRMITKPELAKYGRHAALIMQVKPGLTGYWQVNGRQQTSYSERTEMDMYYLTNWTLRLDLRILMKTVIKVLSAEGAY